MEQEKNVNVNKTTPATLNYRTEKELLALIKSEIENFDDRQSDTSIIEKYCEELSSGYDYKPSDESEAREKFLYKLSASKANRTRRPGKSKLIAFLTTMAALILLIISTGQVADAFGYNIRLDMLQWGKSILNMPVGTEIRDGNISVKIHGKEDRVEYESPDDLAADWGIPVLYPGYLPMDYKLEMIYDFDDTILYNFNKPELIITIKDAQKEDIIAKIQNIADIYQINNKKIYIMASNLKSGNYISRYSAYFTYGTKLYEVGFYDKKILLNIVSNLQLTD